MIRCSICKREIEDLDSAWQKVVGYERRRKAGGTNAIALRSPLQEWVCSTCMVRLKLGFSAQQGTLL